MNYDVAYWGNIFKYGMFCSSKLNSEMMQKFDLKQTAMEISHALLDFNFSLIIFVFIIFFILGFTFYMSMCAAIGSALDNETETQQYTLFAIISFNLRNVWKFYHHEQSRWTTGYWLSMIPFTSRVAMIARIPSGVPIWQITHSRLTLVASTILTIYPAAKIYRVGILMYGNKATAKEL